MTAVGLDLSGIPLRLAGVPEDVRERLLRAWGAFVTERPASPFLDVEIGELPRRIPDDAGFDPKNMDGELTEHAAKFHMPEGQAEVDRSGRARFAVASGEPARRYYTLMNLLRASLAWRLPERGGALVHAAGLVWRERAFLLVGAEGSGKSSWARLGERGGARVLSDDLVPLDGTPDGFDVLGAPFRSTLRSPAAPGRWPLAAVLFPVHGAEPLRQPCPPVLARARIAANLPFLAEAHGRDARIDTVVDRLVEAVPCEELTFALDPSFLDLLR